MIAIVARRHLRLFYRLAVWILIGHSAVAATASQSFGISATVLGFCNIGASAVGFGNYSSTQSDTTATVTVSCTSGTAYNVGLDAGTSTGATVSNRLMNNLLSYTLYSDSGHSVVWGNTVGVDTVAGTGSGSAQNLVVYGRLFGSQLVQPGNYSDTVTATITY